MKSRKPSEQKSKGLELMNEGLWDAEIARRLGVSRQIVGVWRVEAGLPSDGPGRKPLPDAASAVAEYRAWRSMVARCCSSSCAAYPYYGGRGIKVCDRWRESFSAFLADMGRRPSEQHSIDRINNDGNYEPGNCRWATWTEQARNRRSNVLIEHNGETLPLVVWAERCGMRPSALAMRLSYGWTIERMLSEPLRGRLSDVQVREIRRRCAEGEPKSEVARDFGVSLSTVYKIVAREIWVNVSDAPEAP